MTNVSMPNFGKDSTTLTVREKQARDLRDLGYREKQICDLMANMRGNPNTGEIRCLEFME